MGIKPIVSGRDNFGVPGICYKCILMAYCVKKNVALSSGLSSRTEEIIPV